MVFGVGFSECVACELGCCADVLTAKANAAKKSRRGPTMHSSSYVFTLRPSLERRRRDTPASVAWCQRATQKFLGNRDAFGPDPKPVMPNARRADQIRILAERRQRQRGRRSKSRYVFAVVKSPYLFAALSHRIVPFSTIHFSSQILFAP